MTRSWTPLLVPSNAGLAGCQDTGRHMTADTPTVDTLYTPSTGTHPTILIQGPTLTIHTHPSPRLTAISILYLLLVVRLLLEWRVVCIVTRRIRLDQWESRYLVAAQGSPSSSMSSAPVLLPSSFRGWNFSVWHVLKVPTQRQWMLLWPNSTGGYKIEFFWSCVNKTCTKI